jgi:hypothetical protein
MSNRRKPVHSSDPRQLPGDIVGPGGPHDKGGAIVDTRRAILLDECVVSTVDELGARGQQSALAMMLSGRINQTQDRARVLFLFGTDGAAAIITELMGLCGRAGVDTEQLMADVEERFNRLGTDGNLRPRWRHG